MAIATHETIKKNRNLNMRFSIVNPEHTVYTPLHYHNSIEILYMLSGSVKAWAEGKEYQMSSGDWIIIDRKSIHATRAYSGSCYLLIQIPYDFLKTYINNIDQVRFPVMAVIKGQKGSRVDTSREVDDPDSKWSGMAAALSSLADLCKHQYDGYELDYFSLLFHLLSILYSDLRSQNRLTPRTTDKYVDRLITVTDYVQEHYQENISLEDGAALLNLNREYFARFFKKYMGETFLDYIYSIRLQAAYNDLISTDLPVSEIMERNGFTSSKIFARLFREHYQATPTQIRKSQKAALL